MQFEALRISQPSGRHVFAFASTAQDLLEIAMVPRIGRDDTERLTGYQRPEISRHIDSIREYLEDAEAVLPNTIVVAFDETVRFEPMHGTSPGRPLSEYGVLHVPDGNGRFPGFVVDGQQRLAAMMASSHEAFPIFVTAMISPDIDDQRKQFVLVNRTRSLPTGLIYELLPDLGGVLPDNLADQRLAACIVNELNTCRKSSLYHAISTPTCPEGYIKDSSMRRLIMNSLSDGALFGAALRSEKDSDLVADSVFIVSTFWDAVCAAFGEAAVLPPRKSRLTHGVGICALGYVMDYVHSVLARERGWQEDGIVRYLEIIRPYCAWTSGKWDFGEAGIRPWNDLQNVAKDIRLLATYLQRVLRANEAELPVG